MEQRSCEHETSPLTPAFSAHTVCRAMRRILGSCGAAHDMHPLGRWMDGRLTAGARGVPSPTFTIHQHDQIISDSSLIAHL